MRKWFVPKAGQAVQAASPGAVPLSSMLPSVTYRNITFLLLWLRKPGNKLDSFSDNMFP